MAIVKNSYIVKPADTTPDETMFVSDIDQIKPLTHAPTIYVYKPSKHEEYSLENAVHILKESLSKALVMFYPVAGRLHWIGGGRVELHCNSEGVVLIEAESDLKIEDLGDFRPSPEIKSLLPSVNISDTPIEKVPLFLVQITKLSCGGITLGVMLSHVLVDGRSALHFLYVWANLARAEKSKSRVIHDDKLIIPFLDRTVLDLPKKPLTMAALPNLKHSQLHRLPRLIGRSSDDTQEQTKPTGVALLKLRKEQLDKLKAKANEEATAMNKNFRPHTRVEALSAHIWRCSTKARNHNTDQETQCFVAVDFRNRMKPPLPESYFGNAVMLVPAVSTSGELISKPLGYATGKIREAIESVTDECVRSFLIKSRNLPDVTFQRYYHTVGCSRGGFFGNPNLTITSWVGLNMYNLDFGWGGEIYMGPAALGYDGKVFIIPSHDGDGSVLVPLRLQVEHLDAFVKYFYEDII